MLSSHVSNPACEDKAVWYDSGCGARDLRRSFQEKNESARVQDALSAWLCAPNGHICAGEEEAGGRRELGSRGAARERGRPNVHS